VLAQAIIGLVVAPLLAAASTLASRRFGPRVGGVVSAFPAIVGPVLLITALGRGAAVAAQAANGTLLGLPALAAFAVAYARAARRTGWAVSLVAGWIAAALTALAIGLCARGAGSPAGLLVATTALIAAHRALPPKGVSAQPAASPGAGGIPLGMGATALLVISLSACAGALGPVAGGMLAALPILGSVLAVFTHRESNGAAAGELLRGTLAGMAGFVAFCQLSAMALGAYGIAPAFAAATAVALVVQAISARCLRERLHPLPAVRA
jgi:hypothetical protein